MRLILLLACAFGLFGLSSPAAAQKGLGPAYNMKYRSNGIAATATSLDGAVEWTAEDIYTINCGGCAEVWYGPGTIFNLRNTTKKPICAALEFTPDNKNWELHQWGSATPYYLKGGQRAKKVGGLYTVSTGQTGSVDLRYTYIIRTWQPLGKNRC